jgi:nucleoid DNA-binding protein
MAKAKPAKKTALLGKPKNGDRSYTANKLIAHLAAAVSAKGLGDVSKKQSAAFLEELVEVLFTYSPVGAKIPGLGKVVLRQVAARPARDGINPKTGEAIKIPAKPKSQKLVFRFSKEAKERIKK